MAASHPTESKLPAAPRPQKFLWLTVGCAGVYALLWFFYSTPSLFEPRLNRELLVWPVLFALVWLYWAGYRQVALQGVPRKWLVLSGLLLGFLATMTPPFHSTDVFGYLNRGWQQVHYGMNPYVYTVDAIPHWETDPMITDHWVNNPSPYGFLYLLIAKTFCLLGGGNKALTLLIFKLGNLLVYIVTAGLIALGVTRATRENSVGLADKALYLYLWNPLVLIHGLANGHNDMWMGLFVTLSAFLGLMGAWLWLLPALMAATLIKYGALVIMPLAVLFLLKQKAWRALLLGLLLSALLFWVSGLPYLPEWRQFHLQEINRNAFVSHGSLHSLVYSAFKTLDKSVFPAWHQSREAVRAVLKNALLLLYAVFYGGLLWRRFRQKGYAAGQWVWDSLLVMAVLVCLVSLKFYPWYLGMFFSLALLIPEGNWLRRFMVVLSGAQLISITFIGQAHLLNFLLMTGLPIAWLLWQLRRENQSNGGSLASPIESDP